MSPGGPKCKAAEAQTSAVLSSLLDQLHLYATPPVRMAIALTAPAAALVLPPDILRQEESASREETLAWARWAEQAGLGRGVGLRVHGRHGICHFLSTCPSGFPPQAARGPDPGHGFHCTWEGPASVEWDPGWTGGGSWDGSRAAMELGAGPLSGEAGWCRTTWILSRTTSQVQGHSVSSTTCSPTVRERR